MIGRRHIGLIAGAATLLAALPLSTIFLQWTWLVQSVIVVVFVAGAATLARSLRAPIWAQLAAMLGGYLAILTFLAPGNKAILGIIPTPDTFARFGELLRSAGTATRTMGVPVPDQEGLLFLTALGVGAVAICVDLCAVALRRPALAGLPMLAIYSVPVAVHQDSVSVIPFLAGAAGFLWLLVSDNVDRVRRFGRRFTGDGRDIDVWEPSPLAAAGRRLAVAGLLVAVVLPLAVPGMTTGLLDKFGTGTEGVGAQGGAGGGRSVSLWALLEGQLNQDEEKELARVSTADPEPGYLRFGVADELTLEGFRNRQPSGRQTAMNLPDPRQQSRSGVTYREGKAAVEILNLKLSLLPVYSDPLDLVKGNDARWFYDPKLQVIYSTSATTLSKKYEFTYVRSKPSQEALRKAQPLPSNNELRRQNTAVPDGVKFVETKVAEIIKGKATDYDKVRALYDYFSQKNQFTYALDARSETGAPSIVNFLTEKKGFCVQYAAALAWMVREAGIPARVAFGFTKGAKSDTGQTYTLTNKNLHAWTEVYFDGYGWMPFDATPTSYIPGSVDTEWAPNPDQATGGEPGDDQPIGSGQTGAPGAEEPDKGENPNDLGNLGGANDASKNSSLWPTFLGLGTLAVLLLLALPGLRRSLTRRARRPRVPATAGADVTVSDPGRPQMVVAGGPEAARARHDAHAAWDELMDTLVDYRLPVDPAETPRTTAARVVKDTSLRDAAAQGALLLGQVEERARYARDPLWTGELGSALKAVRRALAVRASRRTRLLAVLLPPSVLQRWRSGTLAFLTAAATTLARWSERVSLRRLRPVRTRKSSVQLGEG